MCHSETAPAFLYGERRTVQKSNHICSSSLIRMARLRTLLSKRHVSPPGVCQWHLKESQIIRGNILWSDETKIELFVRRKASTVHHLANTAKKGGAAWCCVVVFQRQKTGILDENLLQGTLDLRLRWRFIFQHKNELNHTCEIKEWLQNNSVIVFEWPSQNTDWIWLNISWEICKWICIKSPYAIW